MNEWLAALMVTISAGAVFVAASMARVFARACIAAFMRRGPWIFGGMHFPAPDDPRWKRADRGWVSLGKFHVEKGWAYLYFEGKVVAQSSAYVAAVVKRFDEEERTARAERALREIGEAE